MLSWYVDGPPLKKGRDQTPWPLEAQYLDFSFLILLFRFGAGAAKSEKCGSKHSLVYSLYSRFAVSHAPFPLSVFLASFLGRRKEEARSLNAANGNEKSTRKKEEEWGGRQQRVGKTGHGVNRTGPGENHRENAVRIPSTKR